MMLLNKEFALFFTKRLILLFFLLIFTIMCASVFAETIKKRPKIGLVLGGGGAAGVAHVGVLKILEKNNIPIDYIAGTSMGAVVGSLYASGIRANKLEKIVNELDWMNLFNTKQPRKLQSFHRKEENTDFFSNFDVGLSNKKLKLPRGAVDGQRLTFELRRLLDHVNHVQNFDKLKIPFRAIATDIETGEEVVLKRGNLATAVRASMSIPGAFPPIKINNRLLVDGYVSNNVPINVVRDMGADILIVVRIPTDFKKRNELNSALDLYTQSLNFLISKNSLVQIKTLTKQDILIEPQMNKIGSLDFDKVKQAMAYGEIAAKRKQYQLKKLSTRLGKLDNNERMFRTANVESFEMRDKSSYRIVSVKIKNESVLDNKILRDRLGIKAGDVIDRKKLQHGLDSIHTLGYFETVDYRLQRVSVTGNEYKLKVIATADPTGNQRIRGGFALEDDFDGNSSYQLGVSYVLRGINSRGGEFKANFIIGNTLLAEADLYQPIKRRGEYLFINPNISYSERTLYTYTGSSRDSETRINQLGMKFDIGKEIGQWGEARTGIFYKKVDPVVKSGSPSDLPNTNTILGGLNLSFKTDTLDNPNFPTDGSWLDVEYNAGIKTMGSEHKYHKISFKTGKAWHKGQHNFIAMAQAGSTLKDDTILTERFQIGGFTELSGLNSQQLTGNHYAIVAGFYHYDLGGVSQLANLHAGGTLEVGNVWNKKEKAKLNNLLPSGSLFVGADTAIGPIYVGMGKTGNFDPSIFMHFGAAF